MCFFCTPCNSGPGIEHVLGNVSICWKVNIAYQKSKCKIYCQIQDMSLIIIQKLRLHYSIVYQFQVLYFIELINTLLILCILSRSLGLALLHRILYAIKLFFLAMAIPNLVPTRHSHITFLVHFIHCGDINSLRRTIFVRRVARSLRGDEC